MVERYLLVGSKVVTAAIALTLAGCGADLGKCDLTALGGNNVQGMLAPHEGQKIVNNSCAGGTCHSEIATGKDRNGAPADLDFDVVPTNASQIEVQRAVRGGGIVHNEMEAMWDLIDSGAMPPEGKRAALSSQQKESVRNWLACGAEVVAVPAGGGPAPTDLTGIHAALSDLTCKGCHGAGSPDNPFLAGDACAMYNALVGKNAVSPNATCMAMNVPLVVAGKPDESLFVRKLQADTATVKVPCGSTMPLGGAALATDQPELFAAIRTWITDGAAKPAGCP